MIWESSQAMFRLGFIHNCRICNGVSTPFTGFKISESLSKLLEPNVVHWSIGCPLDAKAWGFSWGILFDGEGYTFLCWAVLFPCLCWLVSPFRHIICKCLSYSSGCLLFLLFLLLFTSLVCWYPSSHFLLLFSILLMSYPKTSLPVLMY